MSEMPQTSEMTNQKRKDTMIRTVIRRLGVVTALAIACLGATVGVADAHVTVSPTEAPKGGYATLTFKVPTERPDASTSQVEVYFDHKAPIANASVRPLPGWTSSVTPYTLDKPITAHGSEVTQAVDHITWTAQDDAAKIAPEQFQEFEVSVGPLPDAKKVMFKALQTYDNGEVVRWIDVQTGKEEPEHPAPVLTLTKETGDMAGMSAESAESAESGAGGGKDNDVNAVDVIALVVGVAALMVALIALARAGGVGRKQKPTDSQK